MSRELLIMRACVKIGESGKSNASSGEGGGVQLNGGDNVPNRTERRRMTRPSSAPPLAMLSEHIISNKSLTKRRSASVPVRSVPLTFDKCKNKILQLFSKFFSPAEIKSPSAPNFNSKIISDQSISDSSEMISKNFKNLSHFESDISPINDSGSKISFENNKNEIFSSNSSNINFSNFSFNVLSEDLNAFGKFLETLEKSKYVQYDAELLDLNHITSCTEEMLKPIRAGGLGFKREFVAFVIHMRLQIAMFFSNVRKSNFFGETKAKEKHTSNVITQISDILDSSSNKSDDCNLNNADSINNNRNSNDLNISSNLINSNSNFSSFIGNKSKLYFPVCMFDFGPDRAELFLDENAFNDPYSKSGRASSPDVFENTNQDKLSSNSSSSLFSSSPESKNSSENENSNYSSNSVAPPLNSSKLESTANDTRTHIGTEFSFLRGSANVSTSEARGCVPYTMPGNWDDRSEVQTMLLPERFRLFLQHGSNAVVNDTGLGNNNSNNNNSIITENNNILGNISSVQNFNVPNWDFIAETPLLDLPPAMMFLVGLQYGQINVGTWNPFTLAAKRYFALQTAENPFPGLNSLISFSNSNSNILPVDSLSSSSSSFSSSSSSSFSSSLNSQGPFFWKEGTNPNAGENYNENYNSTALRAFKPLLDALEREKNSFSNVNNNNNNNNNSSSESNRLSFARQFEFALVAYYAMNMEILSRVHFEGNDLANCRMNEIFRLEGLDALEPMGMVLYKRVIPIDNHEYDLEFPVLLNSINNKNENSALGSGLIKKVLTPLKKERVESLTMELIKEETFEKIRIYFPKSRGMPRVDDLRVVSGIVYVPSQWVAVERCAEELWAAEDII